MAGRRETNATKSAAETTRTRRFARLSGPLRRSTQLGQQFLHFVEHAADALAGLGLFAQAGLQLLLHEADRHAHVGTVQFHARVMAAVRELAGAHAGARLAVVTHGGVLDMLWRSAHGLSLDGLRACEIPNAGLNRLRWVDGALKVEVWADATHLAEPAGLSAQAPLPAAGRDSSR